MPMVELVEQAELAIDEVIEVMGRATLPKDQHAQIKAAVRAAWKLETRAGEQKLEKLAQWLEREHPTAARSLREGLREMFTINRLGLRPGLKKCLGSVLISTTRNAASAVNRCSLGRELAGCRRTLMGILLLMSSTACADRTSSSPETDASNTDVRVVHVGGDSARAFVDANGSGLVLTDPISIAVSEDGVVLVGDRHTTPVGPPALATFTRDGRLIRRFGGTGVGPGEIATLGWASWYRVDSIVAYDAGTNRLNVYAEEGEFGRSVRLPPPEVSPPQLSRGFMPTGPVGAFADGTFLAVSGWEFDRRLPDATNIAVLSEHLVRASADWSDVRSLGSFPGVQQYEGAGAPALLLLAPRRLIAVREERFYYSDGVSVEAREWSSDGHPDGVFSRAAVPQPVSPAHKNEYRRWLEARLERVMAGSPQALAIAQTMVAEARFSETLPAISGLLVDSSDKIWLEHFRMGAFMDPSPRPDKPTHWSVFAGDGTLLAEVVIPVGFVLYAVHENRLYGLEIDPLDVARPAFYESAALATIAR